MNIYTMTKNTINRQKKAGKLDKEQWQAKLDVFLMFDRITTEQYTELKDPTFKREYDELEPEFAIINAIIDARKEMGLTQKQLSELTGITQADISKLENGNANPSLKTLQRLAAAMGKSVKISFV